MRRFYGSLSDRNASKPAFFRSPKGPQNLDGWRPPPNARFLERDADFGLPRRPCDALAREAGMTEIWQMSLRCELTARAPSGHKVRPLEHQTKRVLPKPVSTSPASRTRSASTSPARLDQAPKRRHKGGLALPCSSPRRRAVAARAGTEARESRRGRQAGVREKAS